MSRRLRLHLPGGTYYVTQSSAGGTPIFGRAEDYRLFERLLAASVRRTHSTLHSFCWLPDSLHFAITIDATPIGRLMQSVAGHYARSIQQRHGQHGHFFRHRHRATLVDADEYLLPLVRYIHHLPTLLLADVRSPLDYAQSSDAVYRRSRSISWLTTRRVRRLLDAAGESYESFIAHPPATTDVQLFEHGGEEDARVIGGPAFIASLPRPARAYRTTTTLEQIIDSVACRLGIERSHVLSASRQRDLALARALITWLATERRIAPLAEVARRLRRDPSTLSVGITRQRRRHPELFDMEVLCDLTPLVSATGARLGDDERLAQHWRTTQIRAASVS